MNRTTCTTKQRQRPQGKGDGKISSFQGRENKLQGRRLRPCLMEAWWCYRQFFLPSDWQRILLFSSSFSCFRRAFSSSRSEIRYGTRQRVTAGCRAELLQGLISPGRRQGALFGLFLLFKRSVPLCFVPYPLYTSSRSTGEMHCYNFPFPECTSPLNQRFQQNLTKYWAAGLGGHNLQEQRSCKWSGHQIRGLFLHLNGFHRCLQVTALSHSCWGNKSADCSQRCSTLGAEMDTVNVSRVNRSGFFYFIVPSPCSTMSHFSASHNHRTSGTVRSDMHQGPWQHSSSTFSSY